MALYRLTISTLPSSSSALSPLGFHRPITYMPCPGDDGSCTVTLNPGDGINPLVTNAVQQVLEAMHMPIEFEAFEVHGDMNSIPQEVMDSIKRNKVCLKGGLATHVGGVSLFNMQLRTELDLYTSLEK